jgi:uncharacterized protein YraI
MQHIKNLILPLVCLICISWFIGGLKSVRAEPLKQQDVTAVPTITPGSVRAIVTVNYDQEKINVRGGPAADFPKLGELVAGQQVPALGRSAGGDWVEILFPSAPGGVGWVYAYLVTVTGNLPIVEPPPTPTPRVTPTIDPTLASQFIINVAPTRLPTFTSPPPLVIPTFTMVILGQGTARLPMGFVIIVLGVVGLFGVIISLLRGR